jgi:F-box and WD-40 domain protein CDC4
MDGTVRVWDLSTGQCRHTLTGHTALVGLLGLSPSCLVSAAADSTLRVWDPESGELRHTLAAHNGAITCFQHDEFKVLSGSDGTLKMWDIRDGTEVRDLLTGIANVWQVVFEGRWCVAASNRGDATVLDVWDFGMEEGDEEWEGEPPGGMYDDESEDEDEGDGAEPDAMDQDLELGPSDSDDVLVDEPDPADDIDDANWRTRTTYAETSRAVSRSMLISAAHRSGARGRLLLSTREGPGSSARVRALPSNDDTPIRPRAQRNVVPRARR